MSEKPWERHWYVVQTPDIDRFGEFAGQWMVYDADSPSKDSPGSAMFCYKGPPISEENARLAAAAPALYRAIEALDRELGDAMAAPDGPHHLWAAAREARSALRLARGEGSARVGGPEQTVATLGRYGVMRVPPLEEIRTPDPLPRGCVGGCGLVLSRTEAEERANRQSNASLSDYGQVAQRAGWELVTRTDGPADAFCPRCAEARKDAAGYATLAGRQGQLAVVVNGTRVAYGPPERHGGVAHVSLNMVVVDVPPVPDGEPVKR